MVDAEDVLPNKASGRGVAMYFTMYLMPFRTQYCLFHAGLLTDLLLCSKDQGLSPELENALNTASGTYPTAPVPASGTGPAASLPALHARSREGRAPTPSF